MNSLRDKYIYVLVPFLFQERHMAKAKYEEVEQKKGLSRQTIRRIVFNAAEVVAVLILAAAVTFAFGTRVTIQEASMDPTLQIGDTVFINKIAYAVTGVARGDLIAYRSLDSMDSSVHVKRVIGLPGETIEIRDGLILINGSTYIEERELPGIVNPGLAKDTITLKAGQYFVLGDNRNNSEDSRFADVGNIDETQITGEIWLVRSIAQGTHLAK